MSDEEVDPGRWPSGDSSAQVSRPGPEFDSGSVVPSGTIVFLFTDIEGSTRLWERDRVAAGEAVRRHDRLLGDAIEAHGGYVFNTAGDSFAVAFGRASDAVEAAIDAQTALGAERWPGPVIRVRMGLHAGEVEERDGDYFGPAANTGARVCGAGHGGQILLTAAVHALVETEGVDLGEHRLRDISQPLSLFQVVADGLESEFPPVRSLDAVWSTLPARGRGTETAISSRSSMRPRLADPTSGSPGPRSGRGRLRNDPNRRQPVSSIRVVGIGL